VHEYIGDLSSPEKWFGANVDEVLRVYADRHSITREDLLLGMRYSLQLWLKVLTIRRTVVGTLSAPNYALFVSHDHPESQVRRNI